MSSLTLNFLLYRQEVPGIKELYSETPYLVFPTANTAATANDAENLLKFAQTSSLKDRVQKNPHQSHYTVDRFFQIRVSTKVPRDEAVKLWSSLRSRCQVIYVGSALAAFGLTAWALRGAPLPLLAPLFVTIIVSACFIGRSYLGFKTSDHQVTAWSHPEEDFARRRKADLELPLEKISKKKCHYYGRQSNGTLLGVEILHLFAQHFKNFAEPLIARKCEGEPRQQHQWMIDFFVSNPLLIDFFKENGCLLLEKEWQDIQNLRNYAVQLQDLMIKGEYLDQQKTEISSFERKAKILQECLRKSFHSGIEKVALELALDPAIVLIYQQRLLAALDEIVLCKVTALIQEFKGKADYPFSFFYSRARYLLCQAFIGLIERKPYTLNPTAFTLDRILKDYKVKLKEIVRFNLQKLIDKAKTFAPDDQAYQKFLLEFFKISLEELFK